jgi:hypothetical protein
MPRIASFRIISVGNIFNNLDEGSSSRYDAYVALVKVVGRCGTLATIEASFEKLDSWLAAWQSSNAQIRALFQLLHEVSVGVPGYAARVTFGICPNRRVAECLDVHVLCGLRRYAKLSAAFLTKMLETYDTESAAVVAADAATIKPFVMKLVSMSL